MSEFPDCPQRGEVWGSRCACHASEHVENGEHYAVVKVSKCRACSPAVKSGQRVVVAELPIIEPPVKCINRGEVLRRGSACCGSPHGPAVYACGEKHKECAATKSEWDKLRGQGDRVKLCSESCAERIAPVSKRAHRRVSVIVTCRNYGRFLGECLKSATSQTVQPVEILVVDDASTDNTAEVVKEFPQVKYLRVEYRSQLKALKSGIDHTHSDFVQFLDADNTLAADHIERTLQHFDGPNVGVVYSDKQRFGDRTGRTNYPDTFERGRFIQQNFVDNNAMIRRTALETCDAWDIAPPAAISPDYWLFQRLMLDGWEFRKSPSLVNYRIHSQQMTATTRDFRRQAGYADRQGITHQKINLFIPLSGRDWAWTRQVEFLEQQTWPHDLVSLILCDTSQSDQFSRTLREWIARCDYPDVRHMRLKVADPGVADQNRSEQQRTVERAMCRIYNRMNSMVDCDYVWILEDDIIPPLNVADQLISHFRENVASATAPYLSRFHKTPVAWTSENPIVRCEAKRQGVESIRGNGFGCVVMRAECLKSHVFQSPDSERWYDPHFYKHLGNHWQRLIDWSLWCEHLER